MSSFLLRDVTTFKQVKKPNISSDVGVSPFEVSKEKAGGDTGATNSSKFKSAHSSLISINEESK